MCHIYSQKDIANIKNEIEKRQRDGDAVFTDNDTTTSTDDLAIENGDEPSTISNGVNANQQPAAKVVAC